MAAGSVKWFSEAKGFGFLTTDGDDADVFVHASEAKTAGQLREGDRVSYDVVAGERGPRAQNVRREAAP